MSDIRYGPVSVRYSGDERRAREYLPAAMQWLRITQERQRAGEVDSMRYVRELAEDAYCYVVLGGGMAVLHIVAGAATVDEEIARDIVPDFVSGAVRGGIIRKEYPNLYGEQDKLATFKPTDRCFWRYFRDNTDPENLRNNSLSQNYAYVRRLAVEPHTQIAGPLRNTDPNSDAVFSQYRRLKPTMYSGTMRKCIQALMGFGRQRRKAPKYKVEISLYDQLRWKPAEPVTDAEEDYRQATRESGLQIQYDWRWFRTHGLTRGADGAWWLVEISKSRGIVAMPLPLHAATTTQAFRERLEKEGDTDALRLLDEFGGFPTGERFPVEVGPWIEAGRVLRLLEPEAMAAYYEHLAYSQDIGWAFNLRGDEAHNCAYRYGNDGCQRGVHYACSLKIGAKGDYNPAPGLVERLGAMRNAPDDLEAIQWKCGRLSQADRIAASAAATTKDLYQFVKQCSVAPLATGNGTISKVSEGFLWASPKVRTQRNDNIKFPSLPLDYLESHNMRPWDEDVPQPDVCDTTMFVFFSGNELKWVKFYLSKKQAPYKNEDNFESCMFIGEWERTEEQDGKLIPKMFYTNDFDNREELPGYSKKTRIKSEDLGYWRLWFEDGWAFGGFSHAGRVYREKRFLRTEEITIRSAQGRATGVAIPIGEREGYYYAQMDATGRYERHLTHSHTYLRDPHVYLHWRNRARSNVDEFDPNLAWCNTHGSTTAMCMSEGDEDRATGTWERLQEHPNGGKPTIRTAVVPGAGFWIFDFMYGWWWESGDYYFPTECSDAADEGEWIHGGEHVTPMAYEIPPPALPEDEHEDKPSSASYSVWLVSSSPHGVIQTVKNKPITEYSNSFELWELPSPSLDPYIEMTIHETHNALGDGDTIKYDIDLNDVAEVKGNPNWPEMKIGELTLVGVIDV